jgi:lipid II:glycine glycyltransferase (peptidoglycan interpeptide bridge formation enzyme)
VVTANCAKEDIAILSSYIRKDLEQKSIYIETRNFNDFSPWKEAFETAGFTYQPHLNFHFDCTDREAMWTGLSETRKRQIHKAQKNGVVIEKAQTEQEVVDWYAILLDLYRRKVKTPLFPLSFFLAFFRQKRGIYLLIKTEGKVIGGIMCPIKEEQCIYEWFVCGMDSSYKSLSPSVMATWAAMEYANTHHLARFDIMGAGEPGVPYGVRDFKAEFGGKLVEHGRFIYICKPSLYRLGTWGVKILKRK